MSRHRPRATDYIVANANTTHFLPFPIPRDPSDPTRRLRSQWSDPVDAADALSGFIERHDPDVLFLQEVDHGAPRSGADLRAPGFDPSAARSDVSHTELARALMQRTTGAPAAVFGTAFELSGRSAIRDGEDRGHMGNAIVVADGLLSDPADLGRLPMVVDLAVDGYPYDVDEPQRYETRTMTVARWTPDGGRPPVLLATTTLELEDPAVKAAQLERCRSVLEDCSRRTGLPVVFGAHLNIKPYDVEPGTGVPALAGLLDDWRVVYPYRDLRSPQAEDRRSADMTHRSHRIIQGYVVHHNAADRPKVQLRSTKRGAVVDGLALSAGGSVSQHRPVVHTIEAVYVDRFAHQELAGSAPKGAPGARGATTVLPLPSGGPVAATGMAIGLAPGR